MRFFRVDQGQEHLHYITDISSEDLYILDPELTTTPAKTLNSISTVCMSYALCEKLTVASAINIEQSVKPYQNMTYLNQPGSGC